MSETTLAAAGLLDKAADEIERLGWCRGTNQNIHGNVCAMGALSAAAEDNAIAIQSSYVKWLHGNWPTDFWESLRKDMPVFVAAIAAFRKHLNGDNPFLSVEGAVRQITGWNDSSAVNAGQVVAELRSCAEALRTQTGPRILVEKEETRGSDAGPRNNPSQNPAAAVAHVHRGAARRRERGTHQRTRRARVSQVPQRS